MLIGEILSPLENAVYVLREFKEQLPQCFEAELQNNAQKLQKFESKMDEIIGKKQPDVHKFIEYIGSDEMAPYIQGLKPKTTKKKKFSFEKLAIVVLPLFKFFEVKKLTEKGELERFKKTIRAWFALVETHQSLSTNITFET